MSTSTKTDPQQNRLIEIDHDSYILPANLSDADMLALMKLMPLLIKARRISDRMTYIPDEHSEYGERVIVADGRPMKIALNITAERVYSRDEFDEARAAGQAIYDAAHPKPVAVGDGIQVVVP